MSNEIIIIHNPSDKFGKDSITIDISDTSYGALYLLQKDLEKNYENLKKDVENGLGGYPTSDSYLDLLNKLSVKLKDKIKQDGK
jgi:hypothetical protein